MWTYVQPQVRRSGAILALAGVVACSDDSTAPSADAGFGRVQAVLTAAGCASCHTANNTLFHGNLNLSGSREADSAVVEAFLTFEAPDQSPLVQRPLIGGPYEHPLRLWRTPADDRAQAIVTYAQGLAAAGRSRDLVAQRVAAAPLVDGVADASWMAAPALSIPISGGFAGDITVTMRAVYVPGERVYFLLQWDDPTESVERAPWIRTLTGWLHEEVAPPWFNNAQLPMWRNPPPNYRYEDKLSIMWNTDGATAVQGFNTSGCAVLCHVGAPGDARPLKYTAGVGQIADMWHWKLVRTNVVHRLDDQYVYWNRDLVVNANGGRAGDPGGAEYAGNSTLVTLPGGALVPRFTSANQPAAPFYLVDSATAAAWAATNPGWTIDANDVARPTTTDSYAVGDRVAYAITTLKPNVDRSDVEAYGVWAGNRWTVEIARSLTTPWPGATPAGATAGLPVDVQFVPGRVYHFGVAVFENAQIEHSWSPAVYRLRFQP